MGRDTAVIRRHLFTDDGAHAYAILDGASVPGLLDRLGGEQSPTQHECLLLGDLEPEMIEVAPYLIRLEPEAPFTDWLIDAGWGNHWGIFAHSHRDFQSIRHHFRALTGVYDEVSQRYLYFRYYDPRVLRVFLPACGEGQLAEMFGPVEAYLLEGDMGTELLQYTRKAGQLAASRCTGADALAVSESIGSPAQGNDSEPAVANIRLAQGRRSEAVMFGDHAIVLNPRFASSPKVRGRAHISRGEYDRAAQVYRDWLADEPDNPIARHHLAACTGEGVPERATDAYVETTFDDFASSFDDKLARLGYRAPELIAAALASSGPAPARQLDILDAGCGTGLCGPCLAPYARRLVGVDLSGRMLAKAAPRQVYDELVKAELTAYLGATAAHYDLVVSADALCYFGELAEFMRSAHGALRQGGGLVFTVEEADATEGRGYRIHPHGRYSHTEAYVMAVLAAAGFGGMEIQHAILRSEGGYPVASMVVSARKLDG